MKVLGRRLEYISKNKNNVSNRFSFKSIAVAQITNLSVVAPGIAEALFATALGLLAAIPAVVAYNKFNNDAKKYSEKLENFSKRFLTII